MKIKLVLLFCFLVKFCFGQKDTIFKYSNSKSDSLKYLYKKDIICKKIFYYKTGNVQSEIFLDNYGDEKKSIEYYENGNKKMMVTRKGLRGFKHRIVEWDENGKKTAGTYIE